VSRQRSSCSGNLILLALAALVVWLIVTGHIPNPKEWFK